MDPLTSWSLDFIAAMQQIHPALHLFFGAFTFLGQPQFYVLMLPLLLWCVDVRLGARVGIFLLLSSQLNTVLKDLFHQPRPSDFDPSLQLAWFEGYGLPSGHAQFVVVFWGAIAAWARRPWLWVLVALLAALVGFSRVYLGVHFPQDIVAGWAIGGLSLALYLAVQGGLERRLAELELHSQILLAAGVPLVLFLSSPGKSVATAMGTLAGAAVGFALSRRYVPFSPAGPMRQRVLRFVVGAAVVVPLYAALEVVPLAEGSWPYLAFRFSYFVMLGMWGTLGAPWLFRVLHLAGVPDEIEA
ncbi:MAG TPA: phosphatase PAP2 family protein [Anaerolineae bacterium]|nr:phosphatase PAP2 family protein [Anaerolineae bacterium]